MFKQTLNWNFYYSKDIGKIRFAEPENFEFVVNCPYWQDYLDEDEYQDQGELREFAALYSYGTSVSAMKEKSFPVMHLHLSCQYIKIVL